jgi:23S rRNA (guanosine2251-2'-O)-methyltransferase
MKDKSRFRPKRAKKPTPAEMGQLYLYGLHPVQAALANPQRIKHTLYATPNALQKLEEAGAEINVKVKDVTPKKLDEMLGKDAVHQGVALHAKPIERDNLNDLAGTKLLLVLDQVTDPHNVGAILRSACAFGADAVVTPARFTPHETGVLAKSASGALDWTPLVEVRKLANALNELKNMGFTCLGFDSEADSELTAGESFDKLAIVLGAEGKGLRQRTREMCNKMVRLDMPGPIKSLNVSNAAAIALFAATRA